MGTARGYAHPTPEHRREAMNKLDAYFGRGVPSSVPREIEGSAPATYLDNRMVRGGGVEPPTHGFSERDQEDE